MQDLWQSLQDKSRQGRPIVLYGMGNGADKILEVCAFYGIPTADTFASDGFVRGQTFHGKPVLSRRDIRERYGKDRPVVLLAFASTLDGVLAQIDEVAAEFELYVPDVPVCGRAVFNGAFYEAHRTEIDTVRTLWADEESRRVYDRILQYKLTGDIGVLRCTESDEGTACREILHAERFRTYADVGAYNGDSIRALRRYAPDLMQAVAVEPDRHNFRKLCDFAGQLRDVGDDLRLFPVHAGAWDREGTLLFHESGNRNATVSEEEKPDEEAEWAILSSVGGNAHFGKTAEVSVRTLDDMVKDTVGGDAHIDYIKYDVEGAEREALLGSAGIIRRDAPALLVSVYHRSGDLFELPALVHRLNPAYRLYLRRMPGVPAWGINLYAVP